MSKKRILVAPIHYVLSSKDTGSEFSWANNFFSRIQKNEKSSQLAIDFVAGGVSSDLAKTENIINLGIFNPDKIDLSIKNLGLFYLKLHINLLKNYFLDRYNINHHFLPFHIDRSFNLLAPFAKNFIVGPIQSKLEVLDTDLSVNDVRGFKREDWLNQFAYSIVIKTLLPIVGFFNFLTLKSAKRIIVINEFTKIYLAKRGFNADKIVIIPPGIDTRKFTLNAKPKVIGDTLRILVVGYMLNRKRMHLAIETIKILVEKYKVKNIKLTIAGDGPQKESLKKLAENYGLADYINFAGFIPNSEINSYYATSDIFLNFSQAEGFATVCLEALASGMIIVSTPVGGFVDAIKSTENGYIIEGINYSDEAAKIIANLDKNTDIATKMSKKAIETSANYDWDGAIIPKYIKLYEKLI